MANYLSIKYYFIVIGTYFEVRSKIVQNMCISAITHVCFRLKTCSKKRRVWPTRRRSATWSDSWSQLVTDSTGQCREHRQVDVGVNHDDDVLWYLVVQRTETTLFHLDLTSLSVLQAHLAVFNSSGFIYRTIGNRRRNVPKPNGPNGLKNIYLYL